MPYKNLAAKRANDLKNQREYRKRQATERATALQRRLDSRPRWPETDLAWSAGLFEGEGTATITSSGPGRTRSLCTVTSTDPDTLEPFFRMWPGKARRWSPNSPNAREALSWTVEGETMMAFLLDVQPFIRTPRVRAKFALLLKVQALRRKGSKDPGYAASMLAYREQMRVLNRRGIQRSDAPGSRAGISPRE